MTSLLARPIAWMSAMKKQLAVAGAAVALAGCSANPIYTTTGVVLNNYSIKHATPYVLQMDDAVLACSLGEAVDPLLFSFSRVMKAPNEVGSLMQLLAANCSEMETWEEELRYLRADYAGNVPEARDARENAKRLHAITAKRRYEAFQRSMRAFKYDPSDVNAECPFLFEDQEQLTFLVGVLTGLQAIVNDANSGAIAGVPRNIAPQAERAAQCLDNEKWGGLPNAIRALVWLLLPDTRPALSPEPWRMLENSSELGVKAGFRTAMALEAVAAETFGRDDVLESVIARFAASEDGFKVWPEYRLLDVIGRSVVQFSSDKYWTQNYGYRTPSNQFGRLRPGSSQPVEVMDLDDLF